MRHRDEVEPPLTDWLREAYDLAGQPPAKPQAGEGGNACETGRAGEGAEARQGEEAEDGCQEARAMSGASGLGGSDGSRRS